MKKLILGIVAVFCVQIMFQVFMAVDRSDTDRRAMIASGELIGPVAGIPTISLAELPEKVELARMDESETVTSRRPQRPQIEPSSAIYARTVERPFNAATMVAMVQLPAKPDVLTQQTESYAAHVVVKETFHTDNRSFFAKAVPILKKPFGWLKAVGSKLK